MNRFLVLLVGLTFMSINLKAEEAEKVESYDIVEIYEKVELKEGSKVMDSYGSLKDAKAVYVPARLSTGRREVQITRIDSNFYQICGTSYFVETKYCYEYATRESVVLNITSNYGYTRGEVVFFD